MATKQMLTWGSRLVQVPVQQLYKYVNCSQLKIYIYYTTEAFSLSQVKTRQNKLCPFLHCPLSFQPQTVTEEQINKRKGETLLFVT